MSLIKRDKKNIKLNYNKSQLFNETTGLNIIDYRHGIDPREIFRNSSDNLINIFEREKITKRKIEGIFNSYGDSIIDEYLNDVGLKNKSILTRTSYGVIEDHVNIYGKDDLKEIIKKYVKEEEMSEKEKYILMGLLQKVAELLDVYKFKNLTVYEKFIKAEINIGIFNNIVINNRQYTNSQRKSLVKLSNYWDKETIEKYDNLDLLKKRLEKIPGTADAIEIVKTIQKMDFKSIINYSHKIKCQIFDLYMYYEAINRTDIINKTYLPPKVQNNVVIDSINDLNKTALLHFFGIYNKVFSLENYIYKLEKEYGRKLNQEERVSVRKSFESMNNNFITNRSIDMRAIGQSNDGELYNVNTSNQLSCMLIKFEDIIKMKGIRGNLALGFSEDYLQEELIATISNKNIHSNKDIERIETNNEFRDFSCSYDELLNKPENEDNTEVVMFRNTDTATLRPSYVLYISYRDINSEEEKKNIEFYKEKMQEAGLEVPFVIFDIYTINKKIKEKEVDER